MEQQHESGWSPCAAKCERRKKEILAVRKLSVLGEMSARARQSTDSPTDAKTHARTYTPCRADDAWQNMCVRTAWYSTVLYVTAQRGLGRRSMPVTRGLRSLNRTLTQPTVRGHLRAVALSPLSDSSSHSLRVDGERRRARLGLMMREGERQRTEHSLQVLIGEQHILK